MEPNSQFTELADKDRVEKLIEILMQNGVNALFAETKDEAKKKVLELIPEGSEVMTMTSVTMEELGLMEEFNESGKYDSVRKKMENHPGDEGLVQRKKLAGVPEFAVGSVHAVTEAGEIMIASNSGSQLPAHSYGAAKVVWVVSTKKIVEDLEEGFKRIREYSLPLENARAQKAYGVGSEIKKILIFFKENPGRLNLIFIGEDIGY
jgi:L-lactate utilization protein LutC